MTPLTAEKIAELERLPDMWRAVAQKHFGRAERARSEGREEDEGFHNGMAQRSEWCADELERLTAPFLSLAKRVAGAPVVKVYAGHDGYAEIMLEPYIEAKAKLVGKRVALVEIVGGEE